MGFDRLTWLLALGLVLTQAALLAWNLEQEYHRTLDVEYARLADAVRIADENISGRLRAIDLLLRDVAAELEQRGPAAVGTLSEYMAIRARAFPEARTVSIANVDGIITATTRPVLLGRDIHQRPYFASVRDGVDRDRTVFSPLIHLRPTDIDGVMAIRALPGPEGQWGGLVYASIDIKLFHELLASLRPDHDHSTVQLAGIDGRVISAAPIPERLVGVDVGQDGAFALHMATGQRLTFHRVSSVTDHRDQISAVRTVADGAYVLLALMPVSQALVPWWAQVVNQGLTSALLSIAVLALALFATRKNRSLIESERFSKKIADHVPGVLGYWDNDLRSRFSNKHYLDWFGRTPEQMRGIRVQELLGEEAFALSEPFIRHALAGEEQAFERSFINAAGDVIDILIRYIPDKDECGRVKGFITLATDKTPFKQAELRLKELNEELIVARDMAEAANHAKSAFLAMMSHELRTPLNSVLGFAELIRDQAFGPVGDQQYIEYVNYIHAAGQHLLNLLNDVLDLSKIEAGKMQITATVIPLDALIIDCSRVFRLRAVKQGLTLTVEIEANDFLVWADERAIRQILFNLLSNAVKFTERGGVHLQMVVKQRDAEVVTVIINIKDTGIGISPEQLPLLFLPFTQLVQGNARRFEGTGLGLVITKRLVEMVGGTIGVESELGKGTTFQLRLPFRMGAKTAMPVPDNPDHKLAVVMRSLRVLVAEDNPINQMLVRSMLLRGGHTIEVANNGRVAVDAVARGQFDLVLMDMQMPEMDGEEATRVIRAMAPPKNRIPIIALTADALLERRHHYLACGINDLVAKPVDMNTLLSIIATYTVDRSG